MIQIASVTAPERDDLGPEDFAGVDDSPVRCLDPATSEAMVEEIDRLRKENESLGGKFEVRAFGLVPGIGSHVSWSEKLDGRLAQAICSIQSVKGVSLGEAWEVAGRPGSEAHDEIFWSEDRGWYRETNRAGGLEGGMTNGEPLVVQAAIKPISTMTQPLRSVDTETQGARPGDAGADRLDRRARRRPWWRRRWSPSCWPAPTARSSEATTSTTCSRRSRHTRSGSGGGGRSDSARPGDRLHRVHGRGQDAARPRPQPSDSGSA